MWEVRGPDKGGSWWVIGRGGSSKGPFPSRQYALDIIKKLEAMTGKDVPFKPGMTPASKRGPSV